MIAQYFLPYIDQDDKQAAVAMTLRVTGIPDKRFVNKLVRKWYKQHGITIKKRMLEKIRKSGFYTVELTDEQKVELMRQVIERANEETKDDTGSDVQEEAPREAELQVRDM